MRKFRRGDSVIVVKANSRFLGMIGVVHEVVQEDNGWNFYPYWVKFEEYDHRPMKFEESEIARLS